CTRIPQTTTSSVNIPSSTILSSESFISFPNLIRSGNFLPWYFGDFTSVTNTFSFSFLTEIDTVKSGFLPLPFREGSNFFFRLADDSSISVDLIIMNNHWNHHYYENKT